MLQLFTPHSVIHGDKPVRGLKIVCGKCARDLTVPMAANRLCFDDAEIEIRRATKKFEAEGWKVGKTPAGHRCPTCIKEGRAAQMRYVHATKQERTVAATVVEIHADPPRQMERTDRRLIFAKLEEAYGTDAYQSGWTDERVAVDLGVPLAWVRLVRDENFGPTGTNPEIERLLEEAGRWRGELVAILDRSTSLLAETKKLTDRGEIIERRLAEIAKAVGKH